VPALLVPRPKRDWEARQHRNSIMPRKDPETYSFKARSGPGAWLKKHVYAFFQFSFSGTDTRWIALSVNLAIPDREGRFMSNPVVKSRPLVSLDIVTEVG
jgi:hypothetical protein